MSCFSKVTNFSLQADNMVCILQKWNEFLYIFTLVLICLVNKARNICFLNVSLKNLDILYNLHNYVNYYCGDVTILTYVKISVCQMKENFMHFLKMYGFMRFGFN